MAGEHRLEFLDRALGVEGRLAADRYELGIGFTEDLRLASRAEAEERFRQMNG